MLDFERRHDRWNGSGRPVHELVEDAARRDPEAIALSSSGSELSYGGLIERVDRVASALRATHVRPGEIVGVCLERSIEAVVSILAVMKSGAAYTVLDPAYPDERLQFIAHDTRMRFAVTSSAFHDRLASAGVHAIRVDDLPAAAASTTGSGTSALDDLAYVIYTSGSTGTPKGVMVTHRNLAHSNGARFDYYADPVRTFLLLSPLTFDSSVAGFFWTLCAGGRLVLPASGVERDPGQLAALVESEQVSHLLALPSLYRLILENHRHRSFADLRTVIVAGETCPPALVGEHRRAVPDAALFNEYGPTEATVWCTAHEVTGEITSARVSIGRPIPGTHVYVVAGDGRLAAPGEAGELYVGGPGVALGYLNRLELTTERFVTDSFGDGTGRLYRTGDLVRLLPDGTLDFLGRVDHQVKIRGHRIELGEIEAVLGQHPRVKEAVVVARAQPSGDLKLVAYVMSPQPSEPTASELHAFLAARLPDSMLPGGYVSLTEFPRTTHGKVDRDRLPAPGRGRPSLQQAFVAPRTPLERWLASTWAAILDIDQVGLDDPFSELGGRSLDAARFINRLQDTLGEFVFIVLIFECPTVAALATRLRRDYAQAVARVFGEVDRSVPASLADHRVVDEPMIARARQLVNTPPRPARRSGPRNPPAIFILAPPRSGTTLLTAMLAGHPRLCAASELNLLGFDTLGERRDAFQGPSSVFLDGVLRFLMDVHGFTADEAIERMHAAESDDLPVCELYHDLQRAIAPRLLLDKSPAYGLNPAALAHAEQIFDGALYVHLSRHPYSTMRSFAEHHMEQVYFNHDGFTARQAAELVWSLTHANVRNFLRTVPAARHAHVRYEDLVTQPERTVRALCSTIGLEFDAELLHPYRNKDRKIPSGLRPDSKPLGDPKFHSFEGITTEPLNVGHHEADDVACGPITASLAEELGYEVHGGDTQPSSRASRDITEHTRAQQIRDRLARRRGLRRRESLAAPSSIS